MDVCDTCCEGLAGTGGCDGDWVAICVDVDELGVAGAAGAVVVMVVCVRISSETCGEVWIVGRTSGAMPVVLGGIGR